MSRLIWIYAVCRSLLLSPVAVKELRLWLGAYTPGLIAAVLLETDLMRYISVAVYLGSFILFSMKCCLMMPICFSRPVLYPVAWEGCPETVALPGCLHIILPCHNKFK